MFFLQNVINLFSSDFLVTLARLIFAFIFVESFWLQFEAKCSFNKADRKIDASLERI